MVYNLLPLTTALIHSVAIDDRVYGSYSVVKGNGVYEAVVSTQIYPAGGAFCFLRLPWYKDNYDVLGSAVCTLL